MIQWGHNEVNNKRITFPLAYSNTNFKWVFALDYGGGDVVWTEVTGGSSISKSKTVSTVSCGTRIGDWVSIGY